MNVRLAIKARYKGEDGYANIGIGSGLRRVGELVFDPFDAATYPDTDRGRQLAEDDARWAVERGEFDSAEVINAEVITFGAPG